MDAHSRTWMTWTYVACRAAPVSLRFIADSCIEQTPSWPLPQFCSLDRTTARDTAGTRDHEPRRTQNRPARELTRQRRQLTATPGAHDEPSQFSKPAARPARPWGQGSRNRARVCNDITQTLGPRIDESFCMVVPRSVITVWCRTSTQSPAEAFTAPPSISR